MTGMTGMVWLALAACGAPDGEVDGTLKDGFVGGPLGDVDVVATPADATRRCEPVHARTADDGTFALKGLCRGTYALSVTSDTAAWKLDPADVEAPATVDVRATPAVGPGVWRWSAGAIAPIGAPAERKETVLAATGAVVAAPDVLPSPMPVVRPGDWLGLSGALADTPLVPLVPAGPTDVGTKDAHVTWPAWSWLGVDLTGGAATPKVAEIDASRAITVDGATWLPAEAIAVGGYAVPEGGRLHLFEVAGSSP